ncbi:response regulator [Niastella caeni]|uniref:Sensory/regulatory protein RpfC n=1 Tax=Niastella caeni TaxID=2569763 RepID=A0A4S8HV74_9BACT|nr:ATP-binding protein [Niastella caeni]THU39517.1 response regulator [Niastella caeni]
MKRSIVIHRKITWLLIFSLITLGVASWFIYTSKKNIDKTNFRINQTYETIEMVQATITAVVETGTIPAWQFDSIQQLTKGNNDLHANLATLRNYVATKRSAAETRELLQHMLQEEKTLLKKRKAANEAANTRTAFGLIMGRAAAFVFVVILLLMLNKDITRHKATQQKLIVAIRDAQQAKQMQEQFLANMSHEIRTPMNGIKGMTDLLLETPLTVKQQDMAGMIKRSINTLLVIINDILDFSKIKAGKLHIEKIDLSLKEVLNSTVSLFTHSINTKGLQLQVTIDPAIPDCLIGDPHRLNQILNNLLSNAVKFTNQGQINMRVQVKEQTTDGIVLSFTITDSGVGIPAENLPYIFDSFSQAGQDISRRFGGTGLGLTICKQLLQLQGGDITVSSTVGKGSTFQFTLPFGLSNKMAPEVPAHKHTQEYNWLLAGKQVLVAEDNEINQKLIEFVLRKAGGNVTIANNGEEAIQHLQQNNSYDLIIMDLQMPKMDGYATTYYIRHNLRLTTPIIAMTATAMKDEQWQCLHAGMNDYMTKPFEFSELYKRIVTLVH